MSEAIKAADAEIGKWYWVAGRSRLAVDRNWHHDDWMEFYHPRTGIEAFCGQVLTLPDDAGYDYELPPPEPDYAELHAKCGLQVGDRVRVTSKTEPNGWAYRWSIFIDNLIGERGTVRASSLTNGFQVTLDRKVGTLVAAWLPCTSLEKIEPEYRPFANAAEFEPHEGRRWRFKADYPSTRRSPADYDDKHHEGESWGESFEEKVFCDGQPFGVEVTQ